MNNSDIVFERYHSYVCVHFHNIKMSDIVEQTCYIRMYETVYVTFLEWRKWNIRPSQKFNDQTAELPESTAAVSGDPGARGSYLNDDEGI